jgi:hypothetical protein
VFLAKKQQNKNNHVQMQQFFLRVKKKDALSEFDRFITPFTRPSLLNMQCEVTV